MISEKYKNNTVKMEDVCELKLFITNNDNQAADLEVLE